LDDFILKLNYLGGNLGISPKIENFIDLELFFLECSVHLNQDDRTKQTILNWMFRNGALLSPSKIRRLMKKVSYNQDNVSTLGSFLLTRDIVKVNWKILIKNSPEQIIFKENAKKYLKQNKFVLTNVPEIRYRAEGRSQIVSDILSYLQKEKFSTLYQLAHAIKSPRNRVNEVYRSLASFELL
jgi:hypothetical protein